MYPQNTMQKKNFFSFKAILVFKILKSPHTCKLTFLSTRGPFFSHKLALVEKFKEIFFSSNFDPFFSSVLQPSGKSYCFETHFTFQSGNCTFLYQILSLYLYWFSDGKGFKIAVNFSRCSKLFAPTVYVPSHPDQGSEDQGTRRKNQERRGPGAPSQVGPAASSIKRS